MKLKLTVNRKGQRHDLLVTADGTATVGDIAAALAAAHPIQPGDPVDPHTVSLRALDRANAGNGRLIDSATSLIDSGLRSGMQVEVIPATAAAGKQAVGAAVLRIVAGPGAGREVSLPFGSSLIGRSSSNDVVLADELVSKVHARVTIGDGVEIIDQNSANGVLIGGQRVGRLRIGPDDVVTMGDTQLTIVQVRRSGLENLTTTDIPFTRSPTVLPRLAETEIELPAAPKPPDKQRFPLLAMIAPLVMGAVMFLTTRNPLSVVFVALSPILIIGNYIDQKLRSRQQLRDAMLVFESNLERIRQELRTAHEKERAALMMIHPSVADSWLSAASLGSVLWWRRAEHPQFLQLRLGLGEIAPHVVPKLPSAREGLADCEARLTAAAAEFAVLDDAPVIADLRSCGSLGLCGDAAVLEGVARGIVVELICMHSPAEVSVACLTSRVGLSRWRWLQWTPHTSSPHSPLSGVHLASDAATGELLLAQLEELVDARAGSPAPAPRGPVSDEEQVQQPTLPSVVVIVDEVTVDQPRLTRIAERGPDVGVHLIWCAASRSGIPAACRSYLEVAPAGSLVGQVRQGETTTPVRVESIDASVADQLGRILSPVHDAGVPVEDASDLPRSVSLLALTGQEMATSSDAVVARWRENQSLIDRRPGAVRQQLRLPVSLRAVVGHSGSDVFTLDLRSQGPHALVGGTTGAGKSEFLQAWVLGMAAAHSPDRVTFLFVDYKGGAAFAKCLELPHVVGLVTDLSPYLVRRALTSLRAELRHREHLLNRKGAKDLAELEKRGDPDCPPSLVIVVDEFAALVGEVPEFVDGVVDVAQRGRSLGLHLILATQRPAGVIKDNLRANTNLRVALRMADEHDSSDVLGEKTAAFFDPAIPGRGAAKTGPGRVTQFQAGYPGAKTPQAAIAASVEIEELSFGVGVLWRVPERAANLDDIETDIDRLVATMSRAAKMAAVPAPRKPWLEALAPTYDLSKLDQRRDTELVLGVLDDPANQRQRVEFFRPDVEGNIAFYGAGGSGKTTALRSLAIAASITPRSAGVHVYGIDFAGGGLGLLEPLPNVGSVIEGADEERILRLFRWLRAEADSRAARYTAAKTATIFEYRRVSGNHAEPRILVLIDGIGTFRTDYEASADRQAILTMFQQLLVDGRGVGIHFAVSADRPAALPVSFASAFQRRVVLRQSDDDGYRYLDLPRDVLSPTSPPGRAMQVGLPQELQLAILGDSVNVAAQSRMIEQLASFLSGLDGPRPAEVRRLPLEISARSMPASVRGRPVLGVADETLAPIEFAPAGTVMIWGAAQSGRTNALAWFAHSLRSWRPDIVRAHLSARRSPLTSYPLWDFSVFGLDAAERLLNELKPTMISENTTGGPRVALFVESYSDFLQSKAEATLLELVKASRINEDLVVAEGESSTWNSTWPLLMEVKNARTGLLLQPEYTDGEAVLRTALPRFKKGQPIPGRGYWVTGGRSAKIQLPLVDN